MSAATINGLSKDPFSKLARLYNGRKSANLAE